MNMNSNSKFFPVFSFHSVVKSYVFFRFRAMWFCFRPKLTNFLGQKKYMIYKITCNGLLQWKVLKVFFFTYLTYKPYISDTSINEW